MEVLKMLSNGGLVMAPLAVCSLLALAVILERYFALRGAHRGGAELISRIRLAVNKGEGLQALKQCEQVATPVANVLAAGLRAYLVGTPVTQAMEEQAMLEQPALHRRLAVLDTVTTLAPLLGLLGTVLGMISSFHILSANGTSHPTGITGGVAEALIATATGLGIAIFTLVGYNWCRDRLRQVTEEMELRATQFENLVYAVPAREEVPVAP